MKIILIILGWTIALNSYAVSPTIAASVAASVAAANFKMAQKLQDEGLPAPGTGVQVVSPEKMHYTKQQQRQHAEVERNIAQNGYYKHPTSRARELMAFKHVAFHEFKSFASFVPKPGDTNLRHKIDDIIMAYKFRQVPQGDVKKVIGFVPAGTYISGKGWTGAVEFFDTNFGASCSYTENNMSLTNGGAWLDQSIVTYDVNSKVSIVESEGDGKDFLHRMVWFDAGMIRYELECGTKVFNAQGVLDLAKRIDSTPTTTS